MPARNTWLPRETLARASDLEFRNTLERGISDLKLPTILDEGIGKLREIAFGSPQATEWTPTPFAAPDPLPMVSTPSPAESRPFMVQSDEAQRLLERQAEASEAPPAPRSVGGSWGASATEAAPGVGASVGGGWGEPKRTSTGAFVIDRSSRQAFLGSFRGAAEQALAAKGLPLTLAPILAAIPVNEQGHEKPAPGENYYGIKGRNPRTGASNVSATWEEEGGQRVNQSAEFRAYDSPAESVADFLDFLESNPRYAKALEVARTTGDPARFIREVHAAGYATDSAWADKVLNIAAQVPERPTGPQALSATERATPVQAEQTPAAQAQAPTTLEGITPDQFGLGDADAEAICGPVLAMAFARSNGRNPTIAEAKQIAAQYGGWTSAQGMGGPHKMAETLRAMGVPATYKPGALDIETIRRETQNGNPVGINTRGHYYVVEAVDAEGRLNLGASARALRASGGRTWFKPEEIAGLGMGAPTGAIYKDAPSSPEPSVAVAESRDEMARVSLNTADGQPPVAPQSPAGASSPPAGAPPWADEQAGGDLLLKENEPLMMPGDGGYAPEAPTSSAPPVRDSWASDMAQELGVPPPPPLAPIVGPGDGGTAPTPAPVAIDPAEGGLRVPARYEITPVTEMAQGDVQGPPAPAVDPLDPSTWGPSALPGYAGPPAPGAMRGGLSRMDEPPPEQGVLARGIDAAGQMLPEAPIVETKPGDTRIFGGEQPGTVGQLWEWRGRLAEGTADALARGTGMDPDQLVLDVQVGGVPVKMTVSEVLENITDPLMGVGFGVGDMLFDATGKAILRLVAPYARGAVRETIGRLINAEPIQNAARAGVEALQGVGQRVGEAATATGRYVAGELMDLGAPMPRAVGDAGPGIGRALADSGGYDPRLSPEPVMPGFEPPRGRVDLPAISDAPNRPPSLGDVPPSAIRAPLLPGMEPPVDARPLSAAAEGFAATPEQRTARAVTSLDEFPQAKGWYQRAADRNRRQMQRTGTEPLSPLRWTSSLIGNVGYSSMLGPGTLSVNVATGALEPLWSIPKEGIRQVARAVKTGNTAALREQGTMQAGAFYGMSRLGEDIIGAIKEMRLPQNNPIVDVITGRGAYAPNPNFPTLSQQTADPLARVVAQAVEFPGRVWSGLPDAIFGTISQHAGEARAAAQIATDAGLKGDAWKAEVARLLEDARAVAKGELPTSPDVQRIVDEGAAYAKRQSYRDDLGTFGQGARKIARLGDAPVLGTWASPFFTSIWNGALRQAEKSPVGAVMNTQPTKLDKAYDALVGSAVLLALGNYATQGRMTGSGPADPKERELLRQKGWQPYSTLTTGPDGQQYYVPNRMYALFETPLNVAGEIHDAFAYRKPDMDARANVTEAMRRMGQVIRQNPYALSGVVSILEAPAYGVAPFVSDQLTRLTPIAATTRTIGMGADTEDRTTERGKGVPLEDEIIQRWQLGTGQRANLPVAQDAFGQPKENPRPGGWAALPSMGRAKPDPVGDVFREARVMPGDPKSEIRIGSSAALPPVPLTPRERHLWDQKRGEVLLDAGQSLANDPEWQAAPPEIKERILRRIMDMAAKAADGQVLEAIGDDEITRRIDAAIAKKAS